MPKDSMAAVVFVLSVAFAGDLAAQPAPIAIDGNSVYRQFLEISKIEAKAYADIISRHKPSMAKWLGRFAIAWKVVDAVEVLYDIAVLSKDEKDVKGYLEYFGNGRISKLITEAENIKNYISNMQRGLPKIRPFNVPNEALKDCDESPLIQEGISNSISEMEYAKSEVNSRISQLQNLIEQAKANDMIADVNYRNKETIVKEMFSVINVLTVSTGTTANMLAEANQLSKLSGEYKSVAKKGEELLVRLQKDLIVIEDNLKKLNELKAQCSWVNKGLGELKEQQDKAEEKRRLDEIDSLISGAGDKAASGAQESWRNSRASVDPGKARRALRDFGRESDQIMSEMGRRLLDNAMVQMKRLEEVARRENERRAKCPGQTAALENKMQQLDQRSRSPNVGACMGAKLERDAWSAQADFFRSCPAEDSNGSHAKDTQRLVSEAGKRVNDACVK